MAEQQFSKEMGAVCIVPSGGVLSDDGCRHRGPDQTMTPEGWMNITARKYVWELGSTVPASLPASLADVVRSGILPRNTVLIIVHMVRSLGGKKIPAIAEQVKVISAAREKGIPIYVGDRPTSTDIAENRKVIKDVKDIPNTLVHALEMATVGYPNLQYYVGWPGNVLHDKDYNGTLMIDNLVNVSMAIVIGQEYGQCVDSTILGNVGLKIKADKPPEVMYLQGLLDVGISVVTARNVLHPPETSETGSLYFKFEMGQDIDLSLSAASPQSEKARGDVLRFAANASIEAATNTDAALTHAGLHPPP